MTSFFVPAGATACRGGKRRAALRLLTCLGALPLLTALSTVASALETVLVTGTHLPVQDTGLPQVDVIDRVALERSATGRVSDALAIVPGLDVARSGGDGGLIYVSARGGEPNFTAFMIDDIPVNDPTNSRGGGFDLALIDPDAVERIEVQRGALSAIYGGEGMSGIVNLRTRSADTLPGHTLRASAGSDARRGGGALLPVFRSDRFSALVGGGYDAVDYDELGQSFRRSQAMAKLSANSERASAEVLYLHADTDSQAFPEDSGGTRLAVSRALERRKTQQDVLGASGRLELGGGAALRLRASASRHAEDDRNPGVAPGVLNGVPPNDILATYRRADVGASLLLPVADLGQVVAGAEYYHALGRNRGTIDFGFPVPVAFDLGQANAGVFVEAQPRKFGRFGLNVGLRRDMPHAFASRTSLRTIATVDLLPELLTGRIGWGEGYKLPSLFALGNPLVGNRALRPEQSENLEAGLGLQRTGSRSRLDVTYFRNRYQDLIDFDPVLFTSVNRSRVGTEGVETALALAVTEQLFFTGNLTYTDIHIAGSSEQLRRRPRWKGNLGLGCDPDPRVSTWFGTRLSGRFTDSAIPTGAISQPGYQEVDLNVKLELVPHATIDLALENLLDQRYERSVGFPDPGFTVRTDLRFTF
ncbi:MAG: TonB-dependent receptor [Gammaproteobacteria bacterium]|nr:TonB-dependent receptor [Gammaproteobacteria bacterium]